MLRHRILLPLILMSAIGIPPASAQTASQPSRDKSFARPSSLPSLRIQNDLVAVQVRAVNDTSVGGEITYAGVFNIGTADNRPLLFNFPQEPFSSHFNVRVDGVMYSNDPRRTSSNVLLRVSAPVIKDSTIECVYAAGPIEIVQRLTPQKFSRTTGAVLIEYRLTNRDFTRSHQAGLLLEMDTNIAGNDQASVLTSFGYSRFEQKFVAPALPDFFQAFQGNLVALGLVAQGTLLGYSAVRPDQLIIGDWQRLSVVQWDYNVAAQPYNDSAVLLRWNEQELVPGQTRTVATYYGRGDVTTAGGLLTPLILHLTALRNLRADRGQLTPNPFDLNLLVFNNSGAAANAVQATINLPPGLALVSGDFATKLLAPSNLGASQNGTVTWKVVAQCPENDIDLNISVEVKAAGNLSNTVNRQIFLPSCSATLPRFEIVAQPKLQSAIPGGNATFKIFMTPLFGFNQTAPLALFPTTPGITAALSRNTISPRDTANLNLQVDRNVRAGDYPFVITGATGALSSSDSVTLRVAAADLSPPYLANFNPAHEATAVPLNSAISVDILDDLSGVDPASLRLVVFGGPRGVMPVDTTLTKIAKGYRLRAAPRLLFRDNEPVRVTISAHDLAANVLPATPYSFTTLKDTLAPYVLDLQPGREARNVPRETPIFARLRDDLAGVDSASIQLILNGRAAPAQVQHEGRDFVIRFKPATPFAFNDTVRVQIIAADAATARNRDTTAAIFYVIEDRQAPVITALNPLPFSNEVSPRTEIIAEVRDQPAGVDLAALQMTINGRAATPTVTGSPSLYRMTLPLNAAGVPNMGDTVRVVIRAADLSRPPQGTVLSYFFVISRDQTPPFFTAHNPPPGSREISLRSDIAVEVRDLNPGVDSAAVRMFVDGTRIAPDFFRLENGYRLRYPQSLRWRDNQKVTVKVQAQDLALPPNPATDEYSFTTVRDSLPPRALNFSPAPFARGLSPQTVVSLQVEDDLTGVDFSALALRINDIPVPPDTSHIAKGLTLRYRLESQILKNDTVHVTIVMRDLASQPNQAPAFSYYFLLGQDRAHPFVANRIPARGAINVPVEAEISATIVDLESGVDLQTVAMEIDGQRVSPQILGDRNAASLKYKPAASWPYNAVVQVKLFAQDLAAPPNVMPADTFSFTVTTPAPDLIAAGLQALENFTLGRLTKVEGKIRAGNADVTQPVRIEFLADGEVRGDTTIAALAVGSEIKPVTRLRFDTPGTHIIEMVLDAGNVLTEADETNNRQTLKITLVEALVNKLVVRPNPFTPNGDGYNDVVEFNFAGLNLNSPVLHIFDVNGVPVWINPPQTGKVYAWNGRDDRGRELQPGVYLYTLRDLGQNVASGYVVIAR